VSSKAAQFTGAGLSYKLQVGASYVTTETFELNMHLSHFS